MWEEWFEDEVNDIQELVMSRSRYNRVKKMIKEVIEVANRKGKYIGICGQAPSDYPEFATFVVECGIQTMSLNPDTVVKTTIKIAEREAELGISPN